MNGTTQLSINLFSTVDGAQHQSLLSVDLSVGLIICGTITEKGPRRDHLSAE